MSESELDIVKECIMNLITGYLRGRFTINDVIIRVSREPLLTPYQKREIIKSPTITTVKRVFGEKVEAYKIRWCGEEIHVEPPVVLAVKSKRDAAKLIRLYNFVSQIERKGDVIACSIVKLTAMLVDRRLDESYGIALLLPIATDLVKLVYAIAYIEGRRTYTPFYTFYIPELELGESRLIVGATKLTPLKIEKLESLGAAILRYLNKGGSKKLLEILGVRENQLPPTDDGWWSFGIAPTEIDERKVLELVAEGINIHAARSLARRLSKIRSINDVAIAIKELEYYYPDVDKVIPIVSKVFNIPENVIKAAKELIM